MNKKLNYLIEEIGLSQKAIAEKIQVNYNTLKSYKSSSRSWNEEAARKLNILYDIFTSANTEYQRRVSK